MQKYKYPVYERHGGNRLKKKTISAILTALIIVLLIAITFLIEPHISVPIISLVVLNFKNSKNEFAICIG